MRGMGSLLCGGRCSNHLHSVAHTIAAAQGISQHLGARHLGRDADRGNGNGVERGAELVVEVLLAALVHLLGEGVQPILIQHSGTLDVLERVLRSHRYLVVHGGLEVDDVVERLPQCRRVITGA